MPRAKGGSKSRQRHKKIMKLAKGYVGGRGRLYRSARETVERGLVFAYRDRRVKKRTFRGLWIIRIGAAAKLNGMSYSQLISGLKKANVELDRKILAEIAVADMPAFGQIGANRQISPERISALSIHCHERFPGSSPRRGSGAHPASQLRQGA